MGLLLWSTQVTHTLTGRTVRSPGLRRSLKGEVRVHFPEKPAQLTGGLCRDISEHAAHVSDLAGLLAVFSSNLPSHMRPQEKQLLCVCLAVAACTVGTDSPHPEGTALCCDEMWA